MRDQVIDSWSRVSGSVLGQGVQIREFCTVESSNLGDNCQVCERVSIRESQVGAGSVVNAGTYLHNVDTGEGVKIAQNCTLVGVSHEVSSRGIGHEDILGRITIGAGSWIGAGSIILSGVRIGEGAVIGAGSVVKIAVPDRHMYVGTPMNFKLRLIVS